MGKKETKRRKLKASQDDIIDDKIIKSLEKKLRLKNKKKSNKSLPKSFVCDGLDYILEICDEDTRKVAAESEKKLANQSDDEFDLFDDDSDNDAPSESKVNKGSASKKQSKSMSSKKSAIQSSSESEHESEEESESDDGPTEINKKQQIIEKTKKVSGKNNNNNKGSKIMSKKSSSSENESDGSIQNNVQSKTKKLKRSMKDSNKKKVVPEKKQKINEKTSRDQVEQSTLEEEFDEDLDQSDENSNSEPEDEVWEDIYGRKRTKDGQVVTDNQKYISPALRSKNLENNSDKDEKLILLRRQLKGLLNRLAESNMHSITSQLDDLYMSNSRNNMNEMLSNLMLESIVAPVLTAERLVIEHMMCIAVLHANVGTEVGAHFIMTLVNKFNDMIKENPEVENKELDNLVLMICQLYNFKVFGSNLVYQIIDKLMEKFTEKEIEIILLILKTAGLRMRKDDPLALKELVINLQKKAAAMKSSNSRVQYMLDVLLAIKNNNMNKIPNYDQSYIEHMKKIIKTLLRTGNTVSQLNFTLQDLLNADKQGKWWIVGSAWSGQLPEQKSEKKSDKPVYSKKILELAKAQRMNTDVRKNIFCTLMTAEDYLDAFEKLHHLGLKERQEREIVYVILNCCVQEKKFNPYYAVLLQKFCEYERKYQMTIQFTLWDKLKMLDNYSSFQIINMAKLMSHLFIHNALPISILKVIELGDIDPLTLKLFRKIMLDILLHENTETCLQVFTRIAPSEKLNQFKEGLRLFIHYFLLKKMKKDVLSEKQNQLLNKRIELVDRILMTSMSKISF